MQFDYEFEVRNSKIAAISKENRQILGLSNDLFQTRLHSLLGIFLVFILASMQGVEEKTFIIKNHSSSSIFIHNPYWQNGIIFVVCVIYISRFAWISSQPKIFFDLLHDIFIFYLSCAAIFLHFLKFASRFSSIARTISINCSEQPKSGTYFRRNVYRVRCVKVLSIIESLNIDYLYYISFAQLSIDLEMQCDHNQKETPSIRLCLFCCLLKIYEEKVRR